MTTIAFFKMSGSGNDFIIVDNRNGQLDGIELSGFAARVCRRAMSVGADGFIAVEDTPDADFRWRFFNADGSVAEMCGNGARCAARFAYINGIAGASVAFETDAGRMFAEIADDLVRLKMTDPHTLESEIALDLARGTLTLGRVNTGVPHVVVETDDIAGVDVTGMGREIRYHQRFAPAGTNVNFVGQRSDGTLDIRTYERGVEGETLACGTGAVAAAVMCAERTGRKSPVRLKTRSGTWLTVHFDAVAGGYRNIFLEGDARVIYRGEMTSEAWEQ